MLTKGLTREELDPRMLYGCRFDRYGLKIVGPQRLITPICKDLDRFPEITINNTTMGVAHITFEPGTPLLTLLPRVTEIDSDDTYYLLGLQETPECPICESTEYDIPSGVCQNCEEIACVECGNSMMEDELDKSWTTLLDIFGGDDAPTGPRCMDCVNELRPIETCTCGTFIKAEDAAKISDWLSATTTYEIDEGPKCLTCALYRQALDHKYDGLDAPPPA